MDRTAQRVEAQRKEDDKNKVTLALVNTHHGGRITGRLVSGLTRLYLTKHENMLFFVSSEAVESNLVKLETSCTVILPSTVSVLWCIIYKTFNRLQRFEPCTLTYK